MRHRWTALVLIAVCGLAAGPASAEDLGAAIRDGAPERIVEALNGYQGLWGEQPPDDPVVRRAQARILDLELSRLGPLLSGLRVPLHGGEVFEALDRRGRRSGREGAAFASVLLARERAADGGVTLLDDETRLMLATNRARLRRTSDLGPERERA